jgi:death-on-curing protein
VDEPVWLDRLTVDAMHYDQLQHHGGRFGFKDENALESALARPRHKWTYQPESDLCALAAAYGFGLARNHGYSDGNKRIAFVAMYTFLGVNGLEIIAPEPQVVRLMIDVASGRCDEEQLATWLRAHVEPFSD